MRAKEYLEINKEKIKYYDIVKGAIDDLCLLRNDKGKTEEYFNKYLFSDARYAAQNGEFVRREGEVDVLCVQDVRINIMNAVCHDESFIFAYNIIAMQKNIYHELIPLQFCKIKEINCDTITNIERVCSMYKEDYPKHHFYDFLIDDKNEEYARSKDCLVNGNAEWWNQVFNRAYEQFDVMRVQLMNGFNEINVVNNICSGDEKMQNEVVELVSYLFGYYSFDLDQMQIRKYRIFSDRLKIIYNKKLTKSNIVEEPHVSIESQAREDNEEKNALTCSQQTMAFSYLLNHLGINTENTRKSTIARFMHPIIGRNEANIRKRLEFDYDDVNVKQNLRIVADIFNEILPSISEQILKDIEG